MNSNSYRYSIFDPAGNVTALVEGDVRIEDQPDVAAVIMKAHPEVEQVGFVHFPDPSEDGYDIDLRMAGGEFCGNASCCASVFYALNLFHSAPDQSIGVKLRVSGTSDPVSVSVEPVDAVTFKTSIEMPAPISISKRRFTYTQLSDELPVVIMEGIIHIIITPDSHFYDFVHNSKETLNNLEEGERSVPYIPQADSSRSRINQCFPNDAELAVQKWCNELQSDGLGLMFLNRENDAYHLTPLVFVPGSGTIFWENSCASGSAAVGMYLAQNEGRKILLTLYEPGGKLSAASDPMTGKTILSGAVRTVSKS